MQAFGLQDQLIDNEKILVFALIKQQIFHVSLKRRKIKKNGEYGRNQRDGIYRESIGNIFLLKPSKNTKNAFYSLHHFGDNLNIFFFRVNRLDYYI